MAHPPSPQDYPPGSDPFAQIRAELERRLAAERLRKQAELPGTPALDEVLAEVADLRPLPLGVVGGVLGHQFELRVLGDARGDRLVHRLPPRLVGGALRHADLPVLACLPVCTIRL